MMPHIQAAVCLAYALFPLSLVLFFSSSPSLLALVPLRSPFSLSLSLSLLLSFFLSFSPLHFPGSALPTKHSHLSDPFSSSCCLVCVALSLASCRLWWFLIKPVGWMGRGVGPRLPCMMLMRTSRSSLPPLCPFLHSLFKPPSLLCLRSLSPWTSWTSPGGGTGAARPCSRAGSR